MPVTAVYGVQDQFAAVTVFPSRVLIMMDR